jgi:D-3-phosphoglycerate dehydrogenase
MYNILTLNKISENGLEKFDEKYVCSTEAENPDAILVRSASMHEMKLSENTLAVARAGAGVNNIPVNDYSEQGVVVFNTPGANANAVKELVLCGLFLSSRKIVNGIEWAQTLKGEEEVGKKVEKGKSAFVGPEIKGKKLGVIGLGAIGILVANAAEKLGMKVYGYDPYLSVDAAWNLSRSIIHAPSVEDIYKECDYITIHIPLLEDTRNFINAAAIAQMKDGVRILNFARDALVNSTDIIEALSSGKVASYATDFPTEDLLGVSGVIAIPHLGASTPESEENCAVMAVKQLRDFLENGNIKNSVNLPNVEAPRTHRTRVAIIHRNIPNVLSKILPAVSAGGINIDNMTNKSKNEYAYTLIDVDGDVTEESLTELKKVDGIIRVRIIK